MLTGGRLFLTSRASFYKWNQDNPIARNAAAAFSGNDISAGWVDDVFILVTDEWPHVFQSGLKGKRAVSRASVSRFSQRSAGDEFFGALGVGTAAFPLDWAASARGRNTEKTVPLAPGSCVLHTFTWPR